MLTIFIESSHNFKNFKILIHANISISLAWTHCNSSQCLNCDWRISHLCLSAGLILLPLTATYQRSCVCIVAIGSLSKNTNWSFKTHWLLLIEAISSSVHLQKPDTKLKSSWVEQVTLTGNTVTVNMTTVSPSVNTKQWNDVVTSYTYLYETCWHWENKQNNTILIFLNRSLFFSEICVFCPVIIGNL